MQEQEGIHIYIDVANLNEVILDEEKKTGEIKHAVHALDTLFTLTERYGKRKHKNLVVEKITGSRLHLYIVDEVSSAFAAAANVASYAFQTCEYLNTQIYKYKNMMSLCVRAGAAYGKFYDFTFASDDYEELTTIGYAANIAAKVQSLAGIAQLAITENIYESLSDVQRHDFSHVTTNLLSKYGQRDLYIAKLSDLDRLYGPKAIDTDEIKHYVGQLSLENLRFDKVERKMSFDDLTRSHGKRLEGIPIFADVRGFTSLFDADDINLDEMSKRAQEILETLYAVTTQHGGIHVQFQGDREFALFHNVSAHKTMDNHHPEERCFKAAILTSMRMIDAVRGIGVHIGVGGSFGVMYATKIGARNEKDRLLLGETVIESDIMEDRFAGEDQIAITPAVYEGLRTDDNDLARLFSRRENYYVTKVGFKEYQHELESRALYTNTKLNNYNGAWGLH